MLKWYGHVARMEDKDGRSEWPGHRKEEEEEDDPK